MEWEGVLVHTWSCGFNSRLSHKWRLMANKKNIKKWRLSLFDKLQWHKGFSPDYPVFANISMLVECCWIFFGVRLMVGFFFIWKEAGIRNTHTRTHTYSNMLIILFTIEYYLIWINSDDPVLHWDILKQPVKQRGDEGTGDKDLEEENEKEEEKEKSFSK